MIEVTQLNNRVVVVNAELIETVEAAPHTILTLTNSRKLMLKDSVPEVVEKVILYRRSAYPLDLDKLLAGAPRSEREED